MDIAGLIALDSTTITVTRHTKAADGAGGFNWTVNTHDETVRLYTYSTRNMREMTMPDGEVKIIDLGLLALVTADFVAGHDSYDTFEYEGRTYRITGVRHYDSAHLTLGDVDCIQCDCVAV